MFKIQVLLVLGICSWVSAWDYQSLGLSWADPNHADYDSTCAGSRQSPVNIVRSEATVVDEVLPPLRKTCSLVEGKFFNDGHTLKFELTDSKASFSNEEYLSGGPYGQVKYFFLQLHLHWGSEDCDGSEHTVDSNRFPGELHMVHVKEDYVSEDGTVDLDSALMAEDGLAVFGIFITGGADNATWFDVIASAAKDIVDSGDYSTEVDPATVNLNQIVQRINPTFSGDFNYWYYNGSLTTPGCQEVVQWVVAEKALQVTDDQLSQLYQLTEDDDSTPLLNNFRLTQPISAGDVYYVDLNEDTMSTYESECTCNLRGTDGFDCACDSTTSQCNCDSSNGYTGIDCDSCLSGWYWTDSSSTCTDCSCNLSGTLSGSSACDDSTGQCACDSSNGYSGVQCDECAFGYELLSGSNTCSGIPQLIGIGGLESETFLGKITEAVDYNDQVVCTIDSFFDATAREGLDDGVYRGMVCDHVHGKTICCGGDFGTNGNRRHCQRDCLSLERASWDNSTVEALPVGLTYPSSTPFNDGTNDLWLVTGGENSLQEPQTAMYTLDSDFTWTKLEHDLPEAMTAHCSVQISQGVVAFIGGVPTVSDLYANSKVVQIYTFDINAESGSEWSTPATLPETITRGAIMGCYKVPDENKVIFGCSFGPDELTYEWNLDDDSITQKTECRNQRGVKFHVMPDGNIIGIAHSRNIWTFDSSSGLSRSSTDEQWTVSHNPPMSVVSPFLTGACSP